jgi:proteasome lid subunit RPN8/RPN11
VVVPAAIREAIAAHARDEAPNESCGLLLLEDDVAVEYVPAENRTPSPYRFDLYLDPDRWADLGDTELEQAVVHSHLSSPPHPSRTDVENVGLWQGKPYLIYCVARDELAAWTIEDGRIEPLELRAPAG